MRRAPLAQPWGGCECRAMTALKIGGVSAFFLRVLAEVPKQGKIAAERSQRTAEGHQVCCPTL